MTVVGFTLVDFGRREMVCEDERGFQSRFMPHSTFKIKRVARIVRLTS